MTARALAALLWALGATAAGATLPFDTVTVDYQEVAGERVFDGVVEAVHRSTVSAQTTGRVIQINFDVDDRVPAGSVIVRIEDSRQRAALAAARAELAEARARRAEAAQAFERIDDLFQKKSASRQQLDGARADLEAARARIDAAVARVEAAQVELDRTVVTAPYGGVVVRRHIELGESAAVGQPLMEGLSLERLRAVSAVPQDFADGLRADPGARVFVVRGARRVQAAAITIAPHAEPSTHTFTVRAELPPGDHGLYPGHFVKVAFETAPVRRLMVPARAIAYRSEVRAVYVVGEDGRVGLRHLRLGAARGDHVEVLAGLEAGERIALDPVRAARHGKRALGTPGHE